MLNHISTGIANTDALNTARYTTSHHVRIGFAMFGFLLLLPIKVSKKHVVASAHAQLLALVITVVHTFPLVMTIESTFPLFITFGITFPIVMAVANSFPLVITVGNRFPQVLTTYNCWNTFPLVVTVRNTFTLVITVRNRTVIAASYNFREHCSMYSEFFLTSQFEIKFINGLTTF